MLPAFHHVANTHSSSFNSQFLASATVHLAEYLLASPRVQFSEQGLHTLGFGLIWLKSSFEMPYFEHLRFSHIFGRQGQGFVFATSSYGAQFYSALLFAALRRVLAVFNVELYIARLAMLLYIYLVTWRLCPS
jgi:hypothetical protein